MSANAAFASGYSAKYASCALTQASSFSAASRKLWREKRRRYAETTPWILQDLIDEGQRLAPDYDAWDLESNRTMIDDFGREAYEQHLTEHRNTADILFPERF